MSDQVDVTVAKKVLIRGAVMKGAHGETGVGLVEGYNFVSASTAKLANNSFDFATNGFTRGLRIRNCSIFHHDVKDVGPPIKQSGSAKSLRVAGTTARRSFLRIFGAGEIREKFPSAPL